MTKTEAKIGNLKLKECDTILEFLFSETQDRHKEQKESEYLKFAANFSHEIKNPLNCILAYAELLKKNSCNLQSELKKYVENIFMCSFQLKCLLMDVIENIKFGYSETIIRKQRFETRQAIENVINVFEAQIKSKNIALCPVLMQANIISDITKFNQILYNFISNAVKFSNQNGIIDITSWVQDDRFYFEIRNDGDTIKKKDVEKIFKFLRTSGNSNKNPEGSGIGLCVSKQLVEAMGGSIEFEAKKSETIFRFFLPA